MCLSRLTVLAYVVFAGALRYVGYGAGHDVRVTLCGLRCAGTVCVCRYGGGSYDVGHTMWLVVSRSRCVDYPTRETLRGSWCVSIHTRVKAQFRST